jgi:hypothetical protein
MDAKMPRGSLLAMLLSLAACTSGGTPALADGEPCTWHLDCASNMCLPALAGWPGGTCSRLCPQEPCGEEATCVALDGAGYCLAGCATPPDCREGYACSTVGACLPDCRLGWGCGAGLVCGGDGRCEPPSGGLELGAPCTSHAQCQSAACLILDEDEPPLWQSGVCTLTCSAACQAGTTCVTLGGGAFCLASCITQDACTSAYVCEPTVDACVPSCQQGWDCPAGTQCNMGGFCRGTGGPG